MKIKTTVAAISILSVVSFGAFAADVINSEQAQGREASELQQVLATMHGVVSEGMYGEEGISSAASGRWPAKSRGCR